MHIVLDRLESTSRSFTAHLDSIHAIQANASEDIVPAVLDELKASSFFALGDASEESVKAWLEDWVNDLGQIYRVFKKNDWDVLATLDAIHRTLVWRAKNVIRKADDGASTSSPASGFLKFLPHPLLDIQQNNQEPAKHHHHSSSSKNKNSKNVEIPPRPPILFLNLSALSKFTADSSPDEAKRALIDVFEAARVYLRDLDRRAGEAEGRDHEQRRLRILQFVLLVDVDGAGMTMPNLGTDISQWVSDEVAPNYPGLCSAVFIVNYSWTYGALWSVIKRILPQKVLARISFPSTEELLEQFPENFLLETHGGTIRHFPWNSDPVLDRYKRKLQPSTLHDSASSSPTLVSGGVVEPGDRDHHPHLRPITPPPPPRSRTPKREEATTSIISSTFDRELDTQQSSLITPAELPPPIYLDPFSPQNPFFGYPTVVRYRPLPDGTFSAVPHLVHGRRRKRDLVRALVFLIVLQWGRKAGAVMGVVGRARRSVVRELGRKWVVLQMVGRMMGLDSLLRVGGGSVLMGSGLVFAAILVRLRKIQRERREMGDGWRALLASVVRNPGELAWILIRDVFLGGVGAGAVAGLGMLTPEIVLTMPATI